MVEFLARYMKAIVGSIVTGLGTILVALEDNVINAQEWVTATIAFLTALGVIWAVPNKTTEG